MKIKKVLLLFLILLLIPQYVNAISSSETYQYVALGDSISAGYEPDMTIASIPYGYVDRMYEQSLLRHRTELTNYSILGITSKGLAQYVEAIVNDAPISADQLDRIADDPRLPHLLAELPEKKKQLENANLITFSIGGNDFNSILPRLIAGDKPLEKEEIQQVIEQYRDHVNTVITHLTTLNPEATLIIMDQYQPYPRLNLQTYMMLNEIRDLLREQLLEVVKPYAEDYDVRIAPVAEAFEGKELVYTYIMRQDTHPNQHGYDAIARTFAETMWGEYIDYEQREPVTILVGGEQLDIPYEPQFIADTVYIPLREYTEALGATVDWNSELRHASLQYQGEQLSLPVQDEQVLFVNNKIYLPLRWFSEQLDMDVTYIHHTKTVFINR